MDDAELLVALSPERDLTLSPGLVEGAADCVLELLFAASDELDRLLRTVSVGPGSLELLL